MGHEGRTRGNTEQGILGNSPQEESVSPLALMGPPNKTWLGEAGQSSGMKFQGCKMDRPYLVSVVHGTVLCT